ncbi:hypothetical protein K443DRAFT_124438 [Laccaria amethystina LaAM-08-1]|uniref:Unplaced genomic scaffold K443scaffold_184, whole genome shotgun sequence n=1 Tax=Laccaria amethystina LaAM-08-1 TaxID=1095629 RepID=A0A0C9XK40_9AGAR|nr:hypothetical protein K443DRAFT_124438 [Laccaria amethystina LaAM-08-1]
MPWGYTGILELENGGCLFAYFWLFSAREFNRDSRASKAIWILGYQRSLTTFLKPALLHADGRPMLTGIYAASGHIPGVRFAAITHPGLNGTAPSAELLATWNKREGELIDLVPSIDSFVPGRPQSCLRSSIAYKLAALNAIVYIQNVDSHIRYLLQFLTNAGYNPLLFPASVESHVGALVFPYSGTGNLGLPEYMCYARNPHRDL